MRHLTLLIFIINVFSQNLNAQDAHFSQFYSNPLYLAPSFAGSSESSRFIANYRDQWAKLPGHFSSYSFSADHYFPKFKSGMGLLFFTDQAGGGKLVTTNIGYLYSYKIKLNYEFYLQPGISAYYFRQSLNYQKINFADQFFNGQFVGSTSEVLPSYNVQHADFAVSLLGYTKNVWVGFNLNHLMSLSLVLKEDPKYSDLYFSVYGGVKFTTKRYVQTKNNEAIHVAFNYRNQSRINQLDIGAYYLKNPIHVGIWYRGIPVGNTYNSSDAIIFLLGFNYNKLVVSYSYDMSLGYLISTTGGSHEISLIYYLFKSKDFYSKRSKYRKIPCPDFF